jgi:phenylalanyl-tRNA synthetase alpha chain
MQDTFFVAPEDSGLVLRTHTSRCRRARCSSREPPIYVVCPGRVYRTDELDATHTPVFHQVEGLAVDEGSRWRTCAARSTTSPGRCSAPDARTRWRPSYFPFTEPSAEFDVSGSPSTATAREGWVEWGGCGMVNPRVLSPAASTRPYSGFAFGMGIERTLMFRTASSDMRDMVEGDVRFTPRVRMEI